MISPSSTNPEGDAGRRLHLPRVLHRPVPGHGDGASSRRQNLGSSSVAILKDVKNDYSVGLAQFFTEAFTAARRHDRRRAGLQRGRRRTSARSSRRSRRRTPRPSSCPATTPRSGSSRARRASWASRRRCWAATAGRSDQLLEIGGEALEGLLLLEPLRARQPRPGAAGRSSTSYKAKYDAEPDAIGGLAYDAANVLFDVHRAAAAERPGGVRGARRRPRRATPRREGRAREAARPDRRDAGLPRRDRHDHARRQPQRRQAGGRASRSKGGKKVYDTQPSDAPSRGHRRRLTRACRVPAAARQRRHLGQRLRPDRAGLHDGLRHPAADQLRPRRRLHARRVLRPATRRALLHAGAATPSLGRRCSCCSTAWWSAALVGLRDRALAYQPVRKSPRLDGADHRHRRVAAARERRRARCSAPTPSSSRRSSPEEHRSSGWASRITNQQLIVLVGLDRADGRCCAASCYHTRIGKAMRAVSLQPRRRRADGHPVDRIISFTFVLGSALAAAAGVLVALQNPKIEPLHGPHAGPQGVRGRGARRHRQHPRRGARRADHGRRRGAGRRATSRRPTATRSRSCC